MELPDFRTFALALAREAVDLATAPPLPSTDRDVVVVTDPHYNTLVAHEIVGHPSELDRGLKMEMAYAGRSWLLGGPDDTQVGRPIASPLVSAYSDPALPGYGHYAYDHDGTPAPPRRPHRPGRLPRLHEQPADGGDLRRRAERALQGGRRLAGAADPDVQHRLRRRRRRSRAASSGTSTRATISSGTASPRSPRAARTSGSPPDASTRSGTASWGASTATAGSPPTRATT